MDLQKITKKNHRLTVIIALVLCAMLVTVASLMGRTAMQLNGALIADQPNELTFAVLAVEQKVDLDRTTIELLSKRGDQYAAVAKDKAGQPYFMTIIPNDDQTSQRKWKIGEIDPLRKGDNQMDMSLGK